MEYFRNKLNSMSWTFVDICQPVLAHAHTSASVSGHALTSSGKTLLLSFFVHTVLVMSFLQEPQGGAWGTGLKPVNSCPFPATVMGLDMDMWASQRYYDTAVFLLGLRRKSATLSWEGLRVWGLELLLIRSESSQSPPTLDVLASWAHTIFA